MLLDFPQKKLYFSAAVITEIVVIYSEKFKYCEKFVFKIVILKTFQNFYFFNFYFIIFPNLDAYQTCKFSVQTKRFIILQVAIYFYFFNFVIYFFNFC